eukprot:CAMPEP_0181206622 /NCGR_PEP_ID=MMETSP1096-20121128/21133_1 /TAXON_ID=156174 ORGANISM="Chrysochromulina ericina, Strain CCMP281" /NCGR_SAMPLE_ID=MMETSP1096 /ASSEMBLY_ACC=CAM_ASM_000453 /LENGTH=125 /DNA_ID=CAMNT_0023297533 /DNA_START=118 /DNA_END=496 /DNA_ORIENTATION=+
MADKRPDGPDVPTGRREPAPTREREPRLIMHQCTIKHHNRVRDRTLLMRVMRVLSAPLSTHGRACHLRWAMRGKSGWLLDCEHQAAWLRGMSDGWDKHTLMHHSRRSGMSNESSSRGRRAALSLW